MATGIEIKIELDPKSKPNGIIFDIQGSFVPDGHIHRPFFQPVHRWIAAQVPD